MCSLENYMDNLVVVATTEQNVLSQLVTNNTKWVEQLDTLLTKYKEFKSGGGTTNTTNSDKPSYQGKEIKCYQYEPNGYCHIHCHKVRKGYSSKKMHCQRCKAQR